MLSLSTLHTLAKTQSSDVVDLMDIGTGYEVYRGRYEEPDLMETADGNECQKQGLRPKGAFCQFPFLSFLFFNVWNTLSTESSRLETSIVVSYSLPASRPEYSPNHPSISSTHRP